MTGLKSKLPWYFVLILSLTILVLPAQAKAWQRHQSKAPSWCDAVPEPENPSANYDSILYSEIAPRLCEIASTSDRVSVEVIGQSAGGRNLFLVTITDPRDKKRRGPKNRGHHKDLRRMMITDPEKALAFIEEYDDFNVPVFINGSIHGNEYTGTDACLKLIELLAYDDSEEVQKILDNIILLINVVQNPDGRVMGTRTNADGFDINRDFITQSQPESRATVNVIVDWNPMVFLDLHGFVNPMLIEPCTPPHNPNYEYDLYLYWAYYQALAMEAELEAQTGFGAQIPFRDDPLGWDDWPPIYAAMYPMYHGSYGHTLETPYRDERGVAAHFAVVWGALKFVIENKKEMIRDQIEVFRRGFLDLPQQPIPQELLDQTPYEQYNDLTIQDFPAAYVIPSGPPYQLSEHQAARLVDFLIYNGVQVEKSQKAFRLNGVDYPKGTYIVWMNQPKRGLANTILDAGLDLSNIEGLYFYSPPSVWSHPYLWGIYRAVMDERMDIRTKSVKKADAPKGWVAGRRGWTYAYQPTSLASFKATNDLLAQGVKLFRATESFGDSGRSFGAGAFIMMANKKTADKVARDYGLQLVALDGLPKKAVPMKKQRIAAYGDEGVSHCLKTLGFDYDEVSTGDLNAGVIANYDVFLNQSLRWRDLNSEGQASFADWYAAGGDYVGLGDRGRAVDFLVDAGLANVGYGYISGNAIIQVDYDPNDPVAAGFREKDYAFVYRSVWFTDWADMEVSARINDGAFLVSGFWEDWAGSGANGMPIVVHGESGDEGIQDTVLIGCDPTFRGHPENTFRLVGNAIYSGLD